MFVPLDTEPLPNQSGDQILVFNVPVLNSSSKTMVVGAPELAGAVGTAPAPLLAAVGVGMVVVVVLTVVVVVGGGGVVTWVTAAVTGVAGWTVVVVTVVTIRVLVGFTMVWVTVVTVVVGVGWVTTVVEGAVTRNGCTAPLPPREPETESRAAAFEFVLSVAGAERGPSLAAGSIV
jgi:hypothetical protein